MKELFIQLAKYNIWANKKFINELYKLSDDQLTAEIVSSFPSIRETVYHMWSAEYIWIQRLQLVERPVWVQNDFTGSFEEATRKWEECSQQILEFIQAQRDDSALEHVLQYYNLKKQSNKLPVSAALMQVLNHATYHRGQLVTMMRQIGVKKIPSTDYMRFKVK